jgi:predicted acetyltransferase
MDLRLLPDAHREAFREMVLYAFQPARGPDWDEFDPDDEVDPMTRYGLYDVAPETPDDDLATDDLVAVCGSYDFTTRVRDDWHVAGGVSAVASPPEHRRTGNVATMLDELLATYRAAGTAFSVLWPFEYEFYRRFGWAKANDGLRVTVPPEELAALCPEPAGEFRRLSADDWEAVATVHEAWATETLGVRRSEGFWRDRMFSGWREDPFVYGWERDGDLRGYVFYRVEDGDDFGDRTMVVSELAGVDREAMDHMLRFCRNHDSQVSAVRLRLPADDPVLDRLTDPRAADVELTPGPMVRLVDVAEALTDLAYPADASASLVLDVADDRCDWNDGRFELSVAGGLATVTPLGDDAAADPDAVVDVGPLSQLVVGSRSATSLATLGDLAAPEPVVETLDALFPPADVYLREGF